MIDLESHIPGAVGYIVNLGQGQPDMHGDI